ncbi:MAG TPA: hypothetical protein VH396_20755 [Chitinophagaceae bacterium]|jgi:hypothetical protein
MKRIFVVIVAAVISIVMSCNPSKTSTNNQSSNFPNSTTDTSTTNHIANPDSTQH